MILDRIKKKMISFKYRNYKEFNEVKAKEWAKHNYKVTSDQLTTKEKNAVEKYCKENCPTVNKLLRDSKGIIKNNDEIRILDGIIRKTNLIENIIVYRIVNKDLFINSNIYCEHGFMSTSLVNGDINSIHRGDYRLKIFLPVNTFGFYANFISCREGEYEYILPRNTSLIKKNSYSTKDEKNEIECIIKHS